MEQAKQDKIWDYYQNKKPESFDGTLPRILNLVKIMEKLYNFSPKNIKVLNIGAGIGQFEQIALEKDFDTHSLDPNTQTISFLKNKFLKFNYSQKAVVGYIQNIPFPDEHFDAVIVSEVLEHLPKEIIENGLKQINRILKNEGYLIGTVPACEKLDDLIVLCPNCEEKFHRWGHLQSFSVNSLKPWLEKYFQVKSIYEKYYIAAGLNCKGKIHAYFKKILTKLGIHGNGENIIFIAQKK